MAVHVDNNIARFNDHPMRNQIRALQSQLVEVKAQLEEIGNQITADNISKGRQLHTLNAKITKFPARSIT